MLQPWHQCKSGEVASDPSLFKSTSFAYLCRHCILACPKTRIEQPTAGRWAIEACHGDICRQSPNNLAPMCDFYNDSTACPSEAAEEDSEIAELKLTSCVKETSVTLRFADLLGMEPATTSNTSVGPAIN